MLPYYFFTSLTSSLLQAIEPCLQHALGVELRLSKQARLQRLLCQYLYVCTSKASKLSVLGVELRLSKQARLQRLSASAFVLLY